VTERPPALVAWDGTAEEFWRVVDRYMRREEIESDWAVLSEVLNLALYAAAQSSD